MDTRQAEPSVDDVILRKTLLLPRVFSDEFTVRRSGSRRQLFPVQINTLSGGLESNLDPERSVQISHVF